MINKMDLPVRSTLDLFFTGLVAPFSLQIFISLERLMKESQLGDAKELFRIEGGFAFPTLDILIRLWSSSVRILFEKSGWLTPKLLV